ncbi:Uncharacterized protein HZ326_11944 [Fusarium oxysporum f. sp. albedinis]|nr:Uncharacterized protein HZ326_11944 [Fusarium oxysporum f. sp. albedinis]
MTGAAAGIRGGETDQAEAKHCDVSFSTTALRETASDLACTSHTVLFKPSSHILDATGVRRHYYNCPSPAITKAKIWVFEVPQKRHQGQSLAAIHLTVARLATQECKCQSTYRPRCPPHQAIQISSMTRRGCAEQHPVDDAWERRREGRLTQLRNVLIFFLR